MKKARFWAVCTEPLKRIEKFSTLLEAQHRAKRMAKDYEEVYILELKEAIVTEYAHVDAEIVEGEHVIQDLEGMERPEEEGEELREPEEPIDFEAEIPRQAGRAADIEALRAGFDPGELRVRR